MPSSSYVKKTIVINYNETVELGALVGGNNTQGHTSSGHSNIHSLKSSNLSHSDHTFRNIADSNPKATNRATAEKAIPLHANTGDDFDEFNS